MAGYIVSGFDLTRLGGVSVAVGDGTDSGTAALTSGVHCHDDLSTVVANTNFDFVLQTEIDTVLTTHGSSVAYAAAVYTLTFNAAATLDFTSATLGDSTGKTLAAMLGFNYLHADASGGSASDPYNISLSGAAEYASNCVPYYYLALSKDGVSKDSRPYHADGQTVRQVSTNASAKAIRPTNLEKRCKWTFRFQTLATVHASEATAAVPWTYEHLLEHAWLVEPCLLHTSSLDRVFKFIDPSLFTEGSRTSQWDDFHGFWNLPVEVQYLGAL